MKNLMQTSAGILLISGACLVSLPATAQTIEATQTSITSEGTVSEFGPQGISIATEAGRVPVRYISKETTNYVDENGNPVAPGSVLPGGKVTVFYTKVGDTMIASKIMVRGLRASPGAPPAPAPAFAQTVQTTTTATAPAAPVLVETADTVYTGRGTVSDTGADEIIVVNSSSPDPRRYLFSSATVCTDEQGNQMPLSVLKAGLPVTVSYTKIGGVHRATRVVVKMPVPVPPVTRTTVTETVPPVPASNTVVVPAPAPMVKEKVVEVDPPAVRKRVVKEEPPVKRKRVEKDEEPPVKKKRVVKEEEEPVKKPVEVQKKTTTTTTRTVRE